MSETTVFRKRTNWETFLYWKLAIAKCSGKAVMAGIVSLVQALNGVQWHQFNTTEKFIAIADSAVAMWLVVDAFLDQTMSRLSAADKKQIADETS